MASLSPTDLDRPRQKTTDPQQRKDSKHLAQKISNIAMASVELAGVVNFGPAGRGGTLVALSIILGLLAVILTMNRTYWRIKVGQGLGWDDLWIGLACVFLIFLCAVEIIAVNFGYGRPADTIPPANGHAAMLMFYVSQIFYKATINCSKLAVICMYLRIFHATPQRWFIYTCWILVGVVVCYTTASMIVTIFQCDPIPYFWNKTQYHGHCIDDTPFWYTNSIYNILTDLVIVTSVPWVVWTLHLPRKQKLLLCSVFGLVIFTFFASIMRLTTLTPASKSKDPVYGTLVTSMWSTTEASCAVITTNLPMLRHTIKALWPRFIGTNNPNSGTNEYTGDGNSQLPPHFHICANCRPGPTGIPTASQIYSSQPQPSSRPQRPDEEIEMQITTLPRQTSGQAPRGTGTSPPLSPTQSRGSFRRDSLLPSPVPFALAGSSSSYAQRYSDMPSPVPFALAGPSSSYAQRYSDMPSPLPLARGSASSSLTPRRNDFRSPSPFPALMTGTLPPRSPSHSTNVVVPAPLTPTRRDRDTTKTPSPLLARFKGRNGGASAENVDGEEGTHILGEEMSHQISNHSGDGDGEV